MAASDLRVPGATGNPIKRAFLPDSTPELQFPVETETPEESRIHSLLMLGGMLLCSLLTLVYAGERHKLSPGGTLMLLGISIFAFVIQIARNYDRAQPSWHFGIFLPLLLFVAVLLRAISLPLLALGTLVFLIFETFALATHYSGWATTGFVPRKVARDFVIWGTRPENVPPGSFFLGIRESITCYLSYNHARVYYPGAWTSVFGTYDTRMIRSFTLTMLLTLCIGIALSPNVTVDGERFSPMGPFHYVIIPFFTIGFWLFAMTIGVCGIAKDAHGFQQVRFSSYYWPQFVVERQESADEIESDSVFLGTVDYDNTPVLSPIDQFNKHAWIVGKTGSGKTTYLLSLIDQIARRDDTSIVYLDLKATSFEALAALQGGIPGTDIPPIRPVKHFTLEHGEAGYLYDLFSQDLWIRLPAAQRAALVLSSLSLAYSPSYGQSWYRDAAYSVIHFVLERHPDVSSWRELAKRIQEAIRHAKPWELSEDVKHDGVHVQLIIKRLAALSSLNVDETTSLVAQQHALDLAAPFRSPQFYYFALAATQNGLIAGEIGRLVATSLLFSAATMRGRTTRTLLFIDEWQCMVTDQLSILLEQARSLGIGVILANQTTAQLITPDADLRPIVEGNTSLQAWLQITDDIGREQLRRLGGQHIDRLVSTNRNPQGEISRTFTEQVFDRVPGNLTSSIGSQDQRFFLRLTDNAGYACYGDLLFVARAFYHQSLKEYHAYCQMPWPLRTPETVVNTDAPRQLPPPEASAPVTVPKPPTGGSQGAGKPKTNKLGRPRSKTNSPSN